MEFIELLRFEKRIVQYFTYFNLMKTFVIHIVLYKVVKIEFLAIKDRKNFPLFITYQTQYY